MKTLLTSIICLCCILSTNHAWATEFKCQNAVNRTSLAVGTASNGNLTYKIQLGVLKTSLTESLPTNQWYEIRGSISGSIPPFPPKNGCGYSASSPFVFYCAKPDAQTSGSIYGKETYDSQDETMYPIKKGNLIFSSSLVDIHDFFRFYKAVEVYLNIGDSQLNLQFSDCIPNLENFPKGELK
jgi:hypothetical protein